MASLDVRAPIRWAATVAGSLRGALRPGARPPVRVSEMPSHHPSMSLSCERCAWAEPAAEGADMWLECHEGPPQIVELSDAGFGRVAFPAVTAGDWCSRWTPQDVKGA